MTFSLPGPYAQLAVNTIIVTSTNPADDTYAARAAYLATRADAATSPNPRVGCVIAARGSILAEGLFRRDGGPHAEVDALTRLADRADRADVPRAEMTAYVSLEPCSIFGRTPPCADRLVAEGIGRVVASALDRTPGVCGEGLARLRRGGVAVAFGPGQELAYALAAPRNTFVSRRRPYTILKQAVSADGFVGRRGTRIAITGPTANVLSHQWRAEADAILIGVGTLLADGPSLTTRHVRGRDPAVVVFDPDSRLASERVAAAFGPSGGAEARAVYHARGASAEPAAGVRALPLDAAAPVASLGRRLYEARIGRLLVEGGPATLSAFAAAGAWDEYRRWSSPNVLADGGGAPVTAAALPGRRVLDTRVGPDRLEGFVPLEARDLRPLNFD